MREGRLSRWCKVCISGAALLFAASTIPSSLLAQQLRGVVRDRSTGTLLENVLVRVDSLGSVTLTDDEGRFLFHGLPSGRYLVSFQTMGYDSLRVDIEVPTDGPLEILLRPMPIELPGIEVWGESVETRMDVRLVRLPGTSRVVAPERVRLYDTIHAKDPWRMLWGELRVGWAMHVDAIRYRGWFRKTLVPEVYIDDHRNWLINLVLMPNTLLCRVELYDPPPLLPGPQVPFQLRAYTCSFMAEVAEGKRPLRANINRGDLIAGPGG